MQCLAMSWLVSTVIIKTGRDTSPRGHSIQEGKRRGIMAYIHRWRYDLKMPTRLEADVAKIIHQTDFNSEPAGPTYSLMVGYTLSPSLSKEIQDSRMVHVSIDPSVASATPSSTPPTKEDDESSSLTSTSTPKPSGPNVEAEEDPDKVNKNVRRALPSDGLLTDEELYEMFKVGNIRSLYDEGSGNLGPNLGVPTFGERVEMEDGRTGKWEPKYTSFTHFWRLTLGTVC
jgi:RNA exonuclease NGL2